MSKIDVGKRNDGTVFIAIGKRNYERVTIGMFLASPQKYAIVGLDMDDVRWLIKALRKELKLDAEQRRDAEGK